MLRTSRKMAQRLLSMLCSVSLLGTFLPAAGAVDEPTGRAGDFSLNYAPIGEDGTSGKLWIGNIGETVFDDITYSTPTGGGCFNPCKTGCQDRRYHCGRRLHHSGKWPSGAAGYVQRDCELL